MDKPSIFSNHLRILADSLIRHSGDTLTPLRRDSLRTFAGTMEVALVQLVQIRTINLKRTMASFEKQFRQANSPDSLDSIESLSDSIFESQRDSLFAVAEAHDDELNDSLDSCTSALRDYYQDLVDRQTNEDDYLAARATRAIITTGYDSRLAYRGRDYGIQQYAFAPSIAVKHRSGFFLSASSAWLEQSLNNWDQFNLTAGYDFEFRGRMWGSLSFTHFWTRDSSNAPTADFRNSVDATFNVRSRLVVVSTLFSIAYGTASEVSFAASLSHSFEVSGIVKDRTLSIEPTAAAVIGEQNSELTSKRLQRAKKGKVAAPTVLTTTSVQNYFGILAYEASLPVTVEYGGIFVIAAPTYTVPVNVIDQSTSNPFWKVTIDLIVTIR